MAKQGYPESLNCWLRDYPRFIKVTFGPEMGNLDGPWDNGSVILLERIGIDSPDTNPIVDEVPPDIKVTYSDTGTDVGWIFKIGMYGWGTFFALSEDDNYYVDLEKWLEFESTEFSEIKKFRYRTAVPTEIPKTIPFIAGVTGNYSAGSYAHYTWYPESTPGFSAVSSTDRYIGFRQVRHQDIFTTFNNIVADQGSQITQALYYLRLVDDVYYDVTMTVYGLSVDSADAIETEAEWDTDSLNLTDAFTEFTVLTGALSNGEDIIVDVTEIVQELIDRTGWVTGNEIGLFVFDDADEVTQFFRVNHSSAGTYLRVIYSGVVVPEDIIYIPPGDEDQPDPVVPPDTPPTPITNYWDNVARDLVSFYQILLNLDSNYTVSTTVSLTSRTSPIGRQIGPITDCAGQTCEFWIFGNEIFIVLYSITYECEVWLINEPIDCTYSSYVTGVYVFNSILVNGVNRLPDLLRRA